MKRFLQMRILLLVLTGLVSLWFFGRACVGSWTCLRLDARTSAEVVKWEIKSLNSSHYVLVAHYHYQVDGSEFTGQTQFSTPFYLNYYAAQSALKVQQKKSFYAWYRKSDPAFSALSKRFPKKDFTHALLTAGVFLYFYLIQGLIASRESVSK
jgi:hypothetical protein